MFIEERAREVCSKKLSRERLIKTSGEGRLALIVAVDKGRIFRNGILTVTGRVAERVRSFFVNDTAVEARAELRLVFKSEDTVSAMTADDIDAV